MGKIITGSFAEFDPLKVIEHIDSQINRIEALKEEVKSRWFYDNRIRTVGFWFFKKEIVLSDTKLEKIWNGSEDDWYFARPKFISWNDYENTIFHLQRIRKFCQLATEAGNKTVKLSKEDALFAYTWE